MTNIDPHLRKRRLNVVLSLANRRAFREVFNVGMGYRPDLTKPIYISKKIADIFANELLHPVNLEGIARYEKGTYMVYPWNTQVGPRQKKFGEFIVTLIVPAGAKDYVNSLINTPTKLKLDGVWKYIGFGTASSMYLDWVPVRRKVTFSNICATVYGYIS